MTQTVALAPGVTADTSTDIVVAAGEAVTVGIYPATTGVLPSGVKFVVRQATPGGDVNVARLDWHDASTVISGPGTFRVSRPAYTGPDFGVFTES